MAKLYFRFGAMNSGKSTLLLQTAHNYKEMGMNVFIVKPAKDKKANDEISSRIGIGKKVDYLLDKEENLFDIIKEVPDISCILVDEAQFLSPEQVDQCMDIVTGLDLPVICYGLRTDFLTKGFPGSTRLLEIAHTLEEMKTICKCGKKAIFNARFNASEMVVEGEQVAIDGQEGISYISMCAQCYKKEKQKVLEKKRK